MSEVLAELNKTEYRIITDSERFIGKIIINGTEKDLYEKIFEATGTYTGSMSVDIGLSSGYEIYDYSIFTIKISGAINNTYPLPYVNSPYNEYTGAFFDVDRKLNLRNSNNLSYTGIRVRVQYTK